MSSESLLLQLRSLDPALAAEAAAALEQLSMAQQEAAATAASVAEAAAADASTVEEAGAAHDGSSSSPPFDPIENPLRMDLTEEEAGTAWEIRRAVEADPEIDNPSDYWYCMLAIIVGDSAANNNVKDAVERARHLQVFREELGVLDTEKDGCRALKKLFYDLVPGYFMSFTFNEDAYEVFANLKGLDQSRLNTQDKMNAWLVGYYYIYHCFCPDFETMRQGIRCHFECNGYDWKNGFDMRITRALLDSFASSYPCKFTIYYYHTPSMFNVFHAMAKKLIPKDERDDMKVGCQAPAYLDSIYLQPSLEAATERVLQKFQAALKRHYQMEREFSLETYNANLEEED